MTDERPITDEITPWMPRWRARHEPVSPGSRASASRARSTRSRATAQSSSPRTTRRTWTRSSWRRRSCRSLGRRLQWLGKRSCSTWPVVGWIARNGGVHPVDRSTADVEAYRLAKRILDEGHALFVFPEGTRSHDGRCRQARDGVAVLALRTGAPIVPIAIAGSYERLAARPEVAASGRPGHGPRRLLRSASPTNCRAGHGPQDGQGVSPPS